MSLHTWSRRKLGLIWLVGLAVEGGFVARAAVQERRERARADTEWERQFSTARPETPAEREAMRGRLQTAGIMLKMRGDTIAGVTLSPERKREARKIGEGIGQIVGAMAPALMTLAVLVVATYLAIPISLLVLTLFWVRAKRRAAVAAPAV